MTKSRRNKLLLSLLLSSVIFSFIIYLFIYPAFNSFSFRNITWSSTLNQVAQKESLKNDSILVINTDIACQYQGEQYGYPCEILYFTTNQKVSNIYIAYESLSHEEITQIEERIIQDYPIKKLLSDRKNDYKSTLFYKTSNAYISIVVHYDSIEIKFFSLKNPPQDISNYQ